MGENLSKLNPNTIGILFKALAKLVDGKRAVMAKVAT
jgi:hypothetical protein